MRKRFVIFLILILLMTGQTQAGLRKLQQSHDTTVNIHLRCLAVGTGCTAAGKGLTGATVTSITGYLRKHSDTGSTTVTTLTFTAAGGGTNDIRELGLGGYNVEITSTQTDTLGDLTFCYDYANADTLCDTYEVTAASDPQLAGDFGSINDFFATPVPGSFPIGTLGYVIGTFVDAAISSRLAPAVAGRAANITAAGNTGIDWANVENSTTTLNLSGTSVLIGADGLTNTSMSTAAGDELAAAVWNYIVETGFTAAELQRLMSAVLAGKATGFNTGTPTYRDVNDTKNRVTGTANSTGRPSVTYDKTP